MRTSRTQILFQTITNVVLNPHTRMHYIRTFDRKIHQLCNDYLWQTMRQSLPRLSFRWRGFGALSLAIYASKPTIMSSTQNPEFYEKGRYLTAISQFLKNPEAARLAAQVGEISISIVSHEMAPTGSACIFEGKRIYLSQTLPEWGPAILLQLNRLALADKIAIANENMCKNRARYVADMVDIEWQAIINTHAIASKAVEQGHWPATWNLYQDELNGTPKSQEAYRRLHKQAKEDLYTKIWCESCLHEEFLRSIP